jgi:hypothetical protein
MHIFDPLVFGTARSVVNADIFRDAAEEATMKLSTSTLGTTICTLVFAFLLTAGGFYTAKVFYGPNVTRAVPVPSGPAALAPVAVSPAPVLSSPETTESQSLPLPWPSATLELPISLSIPSKLDDTPQPLAAPVRKTRPAIQSAVPRARAQEKADAVPVELASVADSAEPPLIEHSFEEHRVLTVSDKQTRDHSLRLKAGTKIHVIIDQRLTVSAAQGPNGGRFKGILNQSLRSGDHTIAEKGNFVEGSFVPAEGENGRIVLALNLISLRTVSGSILPLETATVDRGQRNSKGILKGLAVAGLTATSMLVPRTTLGAPVTATVAQGLMSPDPSQLVPNYAPVMPVVLEGTKVDFKLKRDFFIAMR